MFFRNTQILNCVLSKNTIRNTKVSCQDILRVVEVARYHGITLFEMSRRSIERKIANERTSIREISAVKGYH